MFRPGEMKGRVALVTGAGGLLGRATAVSLARTGAALMLVGADAATMAALPDSLAGSVAPRRYEGELTTAADCHAAVAATIASFGRLDALCNVANVFVPARTPAMPSDDWDLTIALNLSVPFHLIQAAIPHLLATNGAVVNVTSCVSDVPTAFTAAYSASKAGIRQMTQALAMEYIHQPIRFNTVAPGAMAADSGSTTRLPDDVDPRAFQKASATRGTVSVADAADLIAFLASPAAQSFHGAYIAIDKGIGLGAFPPGLDAG